MGQDIKFSKMMVTRNLPKTKFHQMIKSKTKVKDTSGNANRKKAGARFYYQIKKIKRIQSLKHAGKGRLRECLCFQCIITNLFLTLLISSLSLSNLSTPLSILHGPNA